MIIKYYDLNKKLILKNNFFLLYGNNTGQKKEIIENVLVANFTKNITYYEESEIIKNPILLEEKIFNKSFFDNEKLIIIKRCSDKIYKFIYSVIEKNFEDIFFILISDNLEKKSKLRSFFEKEKNTICVPFYEDNSQTLNLIANNFFRNKNIKISQENINLLIERSSGDRKNLNNELVKIESFAKNRNKIEYNDILQLTNLAENHNVSELVDNCLAKNKKKTLYILNENNFVQEDLIIILRTFLSKLKRLLKIKAETLRENNIDKVLSNFKPPIFWKDKEIVKKQIQLLRFQKIEDLIIKTNNLEYLLKKNPEISNFLVRNFILEKVQNINN